MSKTLINIRADADVKKKAQHIAKELGVPLSVVVNAYLREFVRERGVHLSLEGSVRPEVGKALFSAHKDFLARKNITGPFTTADEMDAFLDA
jgi:addiction module RelB/DinJ family antitoxin